MSDAPTATVASHQSQQSPTDGHQDEPKKKGISPKTIMLLGIVVVVLIVGGILWFLHASQYQGTDDATLDGHVHPVSARIPGNVLKVYVDDNETVKAGQLVAEIDPRDYQVALIQAGANLAQSKAQADTALRSIPLTAHQAAAQMTQAQGGEEASRNTISQSRQAINEAGAAVSQAAQGLAEQQANYAKAKSDYNRYKGADPDAISAQQLDTAETALKAAEASRNGAVDNLNQAKSRFNQAKTMVNANVSRLTQSRGVVQSAKAQDFQLDVVKSQYVSAKANVAIAEAQVRQAQLNLTYTKIYAATSGRVGQKSLEVGQRVQAGEPMMSIVSNDIWVVANFKETQLEKMRPGQPVHVEIDSFPHHDFEGVVQSFSPASGAQFALLPPENATGNFTKIVQRVPVKILLTRDSIKGYESLLVPGMSTVVTVNISAPERREAIQAAQ